MKLLSVPLARALWFMDVAELNPEGKDLFTHFFPAFLDEYKFKTFPKRGDTYATDGMKFMNGEWVREDGTVLPLNVIVFADGIAADTFSSTKDSEDFLKEALGELPELGFAYEPDMVTRRGYLSQLNVKCPRPLTAMNPKLIEFSERVSAVVGITYDLAAFELWPNQLQAAKPANFSFQRKIGASADSDRYWSQAAVPTDKHIQLLEYLEALLCDPAQPI